MRYGLILTLLSLAGMASGQVPELSLDECYRRAIENYPLVKQREMILRSRDYSLENIGKGRLPQILISGQLSHQSDVTQVPIHLPGVDIPTISKDQFKLYGEVSQPLTDLMNVTHQQEVQDINSKIQEQSLEVELYKLKDRVNQLFFGALLIDEQYKQNELLKVDIQTGLNRTTAAADNGIEYRSNVDKLKAELLKAQQHGIELEASRKAYLSMLSMFVNQPLDEHTVLVKPVNLEKEEGIHRPELMLYDFQSRSYVAQDKLITTRNLPKFSLFFQGGVGQPSPVNMLSNQVSPYYIGGLRLSWALTSFYTSSRERQLLVINRNIVDNQKELFLFNTELTLKQQDSEIVKMQRLIATDNEIISLRASVKEVSNAQLENGVITVNDFLRDVNAEDQARQSKLLHEVQLLMAYYSYRTTAGIN